MREGKLYGSDDFNPVYILTQISCLIAVWYGSHSIFLVLFNNLFGMPTHLAQLFSASALDLQDSYSLISLFTVILGAVVLTVALVVVVERANKCLDFASTVYCVHVVGVWVYEGFPTLVMWWGVQVSCMVVVVLVSEFFCMKIEQQQISLAAK